MISPLIEIQLNSFYNLKNPNKRTVNRNFTHYTSILQTPDDQRIKKAVLYVG